MIKVVHYETHQHSDIDGPKFHFIAYYGTRQQFLEGQSVAVNLSDRTLDEAEISLPSKGLSFCPTPEEVNVFWLRKDIF